MNFKNKLTLTTSLLFFIVVVGLTFNQISTTKNEIESNISSALDEMIKVIKSNVSAELTGQKALANTVKDLINISPLDRQLAYKSINIEQLKDTFTLVGIGYDNDGTLLTNDPKWNLGNVDVRTRPWYTEAKNKNDISVTEPYLDIVTKKMIVSISTPITHNNDFVGSIFFDLTLDRLSLLVNEINLFDAGYLFLTTKDGVIITHPNNNLTGKHLSEYIPNIKLIEGTQKIERDGINHLVKISYIPTENWYVGAVINEEEALSSIKDIQINTTVYGALAILISLMILRVILSYLIRPLKTLQIAMADIGTGKGDLTKRLNEDTDQEFSDMAKSFNNFTSSLQSKIIESKNLSQEILQASETSSQETEFAIEELCLQTEQLEQLATAMNEMTVSASQVSENAQQAAHSAQDATEAALQGTNIVNKTARSINALSCQIGQTIDELKNLEIASENIESILKVINDIAGQTNLLALNAAIEAARAGDSGRGFAVVADEVRTLAQRTQDATTEIRLLIEKLQFGMATVAKTMDSNQSTVTETVNLANVANDALTQIQKSIVQINDMNFQIASAAEQQSLVSSEINENTIKIKDISDSVAQTAKSDFISMKTQTENIRKQSNIIEEFKVE